MSIFTKTKLYIKQYPYYFASFVVILLCSISLFIINPPRQADESFHTLQIKRIFREDHRFVVELTTIPGYHYMIAYAARLSDPLVHYKKHPKTQQIRIFHAMLSLFLPILLFYIVRALKQNDKLPLIIILTPIIFPFLFLSYTDIPSLLFILAAFLAYLNKRNDLAGFILLLSLLIRQDNIVWLLAFFSLFTWDAYLIEGRRIGISFIKYFFTNGLSYIISLILFSLFYIFNGGVAIGDKEAHPAMTLHAGNLWLFLIVVFILLLPLIISARHRIYRLLSVSWYISVPVLIGGYFVFRFTYSVDHPYNTSLSYFHNVFAQFVEMNTLAAVVSYGMIIVAILYLVSAKYIKNKYAFIPLFIIIYLALHWMIEFRYMIIPLVLIFLILRHDKKYLRYQLIYFIVFAVFAFYYFFIDRGLFL